MYCITFTIHYFSENVWNWGGKVHFCHILHSITLDIFFVELRDPRLSLWVSKATIENKCQLPSPKLKTSIWWDLHYYWKNGLFENDSRQTMSKRFVVFGKQKYKIIYIFLLGRGTSGFEASSLHCSTSNLTENYKKSIKWWPLCVC